MPAPPGAATPATDSPRRPADGVYTYATRGGGQTNALGGARHDYPSAVPLTVTHTACGFNVRWQPLEERWDEWEFCLDGQSMVMNRITTYHEFFRKGLRQDFDCGGTHVLAHRSPGQRWEWQCRSRNSTIEATGVVVAVETVDVGGTPVEAVRIRNDATFTGANEGRQRFEWWLAVESGLPIRMLRSVQTRSESPFGKVDYTEDADTTAASMTPRR